MISTGEVNSREPHKIQCIIREQLRFEWFQLNHPMGYMSPLVTSFLPHNFRVKKLDFSRFLMWNFPISAISRNSKLKSTKFSNQNKSSLLLSWLYDWFLFLTQGGWEDVDLTMCVQKVTLKFVGHLCSLELLCWIIWDLGNLLPYYGKDFPIIKGAGLRLPLTNWRDQRSEVLAL